MNSIAELFPIQVANQIFELVFIHWVSAPQSIHIEFDQIVMRKIFGKIKLTTILILNLWKAFKQCVKQV